MRWQQLLKKLNTLLVLDPRSTIVYEGDSMRIPFTLQPSSEAIHESPLVTQQ